MCAGEIHQNVKIIVNALHKLGQKGYEELMATMVCDTNSRNWVINILRGHANICTLIRRWMKILRGFSGTMFASSKQLNINHILTSHDLFQ